MKTLSNMKFNHDLEVAYRLLAACFYQPAPEWAEEELFANLEAALRGVAPAEADKAPAMARSFAAEGVETLTVDYAALFVGPARLLAPPYGSVHLEPEKRVMGETTMAVHSFYLASGLALDEEFAEVPDHIAVELEFMSYLVQRAIAAAAAGDDAEVAAWVARRREFLATFLYSWSAPFCEEIRNGSKTAFYSALADCLEGVIAADLRLAGGEEARQGADW